MDPIFAGTLFYLVYPLGSIVLGYYLLKLLISVIKSPACEYDSGKYQKNGDGALNKALATIISWALIIGFITLNGFLISKAIEYAPKPPVLIRFK